MNSNITFDLKNHEFCVESPEKGIDYSSIKLPLSMIVQVTRRCNLNCKFCSESESFEDPSIGELESVCDKLKGVKRIYLSGGEPLIRKDIFEIIDMYKEKFDVLGLPTNCSKIDNDVYKKLLGKISYVNAGLDGPRGINDQYRGNYDEIISGLNILKDSGIEVSLSTVILKDTLPYLNYVVQIADLLNVVKVKMVVPVLRGRARSLQDSDFVNDEIIMKKFEELKMLKSNLNWKPRIKLALWSKDTEGYALLVFPNQKVFAWPVFDKDDCVEYIGDLHSESMNDIWEKYPYKKNHIDKYVGITVNKG